MFLIIGIVCIVLWLLGFTVFNITDWFIHLLLAVALIMIALGILGKM